MMRVVSSRLLKGAVGIALGLCVAAVPGYCSTFLAFTTTTTGGSIQVTGTNQANQTLSSLSGVAYTLLQISGTPGDAADVGFWNLSGVTESLNVSTDTLTVSGTILSCQSGCTGGNLSGVSGALETIKLSSLAEGTVFTTNGNTPTSVNVSYGTPTSVNELAALANDLAGLASNASTTQTNTFGSSSIVGTGSSGSSPYSFTTTSQTLNVTLNSVVLTPEPVSFLLLGSGLLGIALMARRKSSQA